MRQLFDITGMSCAACAARVEKAVRNLPAVKQANVNLLHNLLQVEYDEAQLSGSQIEQAVAQAGYGARLHAAKAQHAQGVSQTQQLQRRFIYSLCFLVPLVYLSAGSMNRWPGCAWGQQWPEMLAWVQLLLACPIMWWNRIFFTRGIKQFIQASPTMDSLVALGAGVCMASGMVVLSCVRMGQCVASGGFYFESAAMIVTLVTFGKWLEARAKAKTVGALQSLVQLLPTTACVLRQGQELRIPVDQVHLHDILLIRQGERVAADGLIIQGACAVDESSLTGESLPLDKEVGGTLSAGTLLCSGSVQLQVSRVGADTTLARLVSLVQEASSSKAPIAQLADRVSAVFVPVVLLIAFITWIGWLISGAEMGFALSCAVSVLVIACPCALGLATPTAITVGMGLAAKRGVLFKSAQELEKAHDVRCVVLDKTGTVTTGKMQVIRVEPNAGITEEKLLQVAVSVEHASSHPLARALTAFAQTKNITPLFTSHFTAVAGRGVWALQNQTRLAGGNEAWMQELKIPFPQTQQTVAQAAKLGATPLFFAQGEHALGSVWFADTVKPQAAQAVAELKALGVRTVLLTGDNPYAAQWVAQQIGIEEVMAGVLPHDKDALIRRLQQEGYTVAMVGDGINDAAALVRADVGISLANATDVAEQAAQVVLMKDDLRDISFVIYLSRAVVRTIQQNLFWAFFYNVLGIVLATGIFYHPLGWKLTPSFAAAAMSLSSVCVVSNALRLRFFTSAISDKQQTGDIKMQKIIAIQGMSCAHCVARVERALNALPGVKARVDLGKKEALIQLTQEVPDELLIQAVQDAGYKVERVK